MENDDIEINFSSELKKFENLRSYKFLVIGDTQVGKSHLLELITGEMNLKKTQNKTKKTVGCDIHVFCKTNPRPLLPSTMMTMTWSCVIELWEISGDPKYTPYIKVYTQEQINQFKGVIYIFDMTNLKTLQNIKKHLKNIFETHLSSSSSLSTSSSLEYDYSPQNRNGNSNRYLNNNKNFCMPLLIVGNKISFLNPNDRYEKVKQIKKDIQEIFSEKQGHNLKIAFISTTTDGQIRNEISMDNDLDSEDIGNGYNQLIKFIDNCICGDDDFSYLENEFLIDSSIDFESTAKYQYYTRKKLADLNATLKQAFHKITSTILNVFTYFVPAKRLEV